MTRDAGDLRFRPGGASSRPCYGRMPLHVGLVRLDPPAGARVAEAFVRAALSVIGPNGDPTDEAFEVWPEGDGVRVDRHAAPEARALTAGAGGPVSIGARPKVTTSAGSSSCACLRRLDASTSRRTGAAALVQAPAFAMVTDLSAGGLDREPSRAGWVEVGALDPLHRERLDPRLVHLHLLLITIYPMFTGLGLLDARLRLTLSHIVFALPVATSML